MGLKISAVIILLVFYGCYFAKIFLQKKKGIQTAQMGKGKTGVVKIIELTLSMVTILVPVVEVISICDGNVSFTNCKCGRRFFGYSIRK